MLKILIGCESSGVVRDAFRALGHDAFSCDILPCEGDPRWHIQGDVFDALNADFFDIAILHPPCTRLTVSGQWYVQRHPKAMEEQREAIRFVETLWNVAKRRARAVALENPVGILSTKSELGKPSQIIQPFDFGEDASKKTCLWLHKLPALVGTKRFPPRMVNGRPRWSNQTDSGQNRLPPSEDRWKERARTYEGIADAMAAQWSAALAGQPMEGMLF